MGGKRITSEAWEEARQLYEVSGLSMEHVSKDTGISLASISKKAKKDQWKKGKGEEIIKAKIELYQKVDSIRKEEERLLPKIKDDLDFQYQRAKRLANKISDHIEKTQDVMDDLLNDSIVEAQKMGTVQERATLLIPVTDACSKVVSRNAKVVFGNEGTEQQRETGNDAADERRRAIVAKIRARHAARVSAG